MQHRIVGIEEEDLLRMHETEEMSPYKIAEHYGVAPTTVCNRMKEYGIKSRTRSEANRWNTKARKYSINEDFFKTWTSKSAWVLGWALGDGCFTKSRQGLRFCLSRKDKDVLYKIKKTLNSEHPIYDYTNSGYTHCEMSGICFFSKGMTLDLKALSYAEVPIVYFSDFVRGFWEAEGSVYWHRSEKLKKGGCLGLNFTQGDINILDFIQCNLKDLGIVKGGSMCSYDKTWKLTFSTNDGIALYHYMYDNCRNMTLPRKKAKFEELIKRQRGDING